MDIDVLTIFPGYFDRTLDQSMLGRAITQDKVTIRVTDFRDFACDRHRTVDDYPYGGGAGMVIKPEPIFCAMDVVCPADGPKTRVLLMSPQGRPFDQAFARELAGEDRLLFLCGHYEGFDERIREALVTDEVSIGDYVLTSGELAALVIIDAVVRLLPGVLGNEDSAAGDSFSDGLLEYPQYTRPEEFRGMRVPPVLLSGHHGEVAKWRRLQSLLRTRERRPDLFVRYELTPEERGWLRRHDETVGTRDRPDKGNQASDD
ncbi:MAG: tRNA (guanosine(37)-N1)-methyltransferase TrmD [Firmicutes bacterium]|nr:tRNA (guanosine(37)-N1)-methyltransferase TrmD [Bacillota bacterium]